MLIEGVDNYTIGETGEDNSLHFGGATNKITVDGVTATIKAGITGSPDIHTPGGFREHLYLDPATADMTIGEIHVGLGSSSNPVLDLRGSTNGNTIIKIQKEQNYTFLYVNSTGTWTVGDVDVGQGNLQAGTLVVNGTWVTPWSGLNFSGGRLAGTGTINDNVSVPSGGALAPGNLDVGTLSIVGDTTMKAGAILEWEFHIEGDLVNVDGDLQLDNLWVLKLVDLGDDPLGSQEYDLFTVTGNYNGSPVTDAITLLEGTNYTVDVNSAPDWDVDDIEVVVDTTETGFRVYVTGIGEMILAGDADGDGDVDAADYIMVKTHFGGPPATGTAGTGGDFNENGTVDWDDLQTLQAAFGQGAGADTIPEPATLFIVLAAGLPALLKRRRSRL